MSVVFHLKPLCVVVSLAAVVLRVLSWFSVISAFSCRGISILTVVHMVVSDCRVEISLTVHHPVSFNSFLVLVLLPD